MVCDEEGLRLSAKDPTPQAEVKSHPSKNEGWGTRLFRVASLFAAGSGNLAKNSVVFLIGARCEKQFGGQATIGVIPAEAQPPQPIDPQRIARLVQECAF